MAKHNGSINYLSFPFGETVVTLAEDRGKLGTNQWGEFFSRNFIEPAGKFSCCSPELERLIVDSGAKRDSVISVVKEKYGQGCIWRVKVLGAAPTPIRTNGHTNGHANGVAHAWNDLPAEKYAPSPADAENVKALEVAREPKNLLERAAVAAVDAALFVESYAAQHGRPLTVPAESIAAWASTLLINAR